MTPLSRTLHFPPQVRTCGKVVAGMIKMYEAEVLGKLPVLQHFLFGSILPLRWTSSTFRDSNGCTHGGHVHEGWGDCCGIPIPSAFAAQEKEEGRSRGPGYYLFHLIDMIKHNGVGSW
ncbi:hypothetical protein EDD15DRAFT_1153784 [Pisolithus albus]|nr:hypothetical protein EDD15DRAFT_1153784 [Pisolithus albus]